MKKRTHIPALQGQRLYQALNALDRLPVRKGAKKALKQMLVEAAHPDRNAPGRLGALGDNMVQTAAQLAARDLQHLACVQALIDLDLDDDAWVDEMERRHDHP